MPHGSPAPVHAPTPRLAPPNPTREEEAARRGDAYEGRSVCCAVTRCGVVWVCLACAVCLGGSSLEAACRFGSGRLVGGRVLWTACVGEQVRGGVCEAVKEHGHSRMGMGGGVPCGRCF
jgi:hypothetical protein